MFKHAFQLPDRFHVAAVQVATVWTNPESARQIDQLAAGEAADMEEWLGNLSQEEKLALCEDSRIQTQVLYGEAVIITEVKGDWAKVIIPSQPSNKDKNGYPGWIPLQQLKIMRRDEWVRPQMAAIKQKHAWLESENGKKLIRLSYMTCLPVEDVKASKVEVVTPQGKGYLPKDAVEVFRTAYGGEQRDGSNIIKEGEQYIGLEYLWGGMSAFGYDCSGFAYAVHKANGYRIARDASDQAAEGRRVPLDEVMPGDLLFFAYEEGKGNIHHVGIYYGEGKMLHSPSTGRGIEIAHLAGTTYERELCIARRYWEAGAV